MKVIIASGGRFHAYALAQQLIKRQALQRLYTFDYTTRDAQKVPPALVNCNHVCGLLNTFFEKGRLGRIINRTTFNSFKDSIFERGVAHGLAKEQHVDLLVSWSGFLHTSATQARNKGAKIILETGSCHTDTQKALIQAEYARYGLTLKSHNEKRQAQARLEYEEADLIMAPSSFVQQSFLQRGLTPTKIAVVPYGVDLAFFKPLTEARATKKFSLLFVGMVSLQKGIHYLLHAWQEAQLPLHEAELVIVGALQKDFLLIKHRLPLSSNIRFIGGINREALRRMYQQATAFVLPSIQEGLAMVIGEAMASGLPVIVSTHTGGQDLVTHGHSGLLYNPYDIDALTRQIVWCYNNRNEAATMGINAHKRIQAFSWNAYGTRVFNIYKQLVGHE
ncbi:glycosyltransferase family 4 protein [Candidatus Dependentiae bacterium]|nr:glycosyltransferase family 4 protein [Candidatus Dependentiae bacterium]